MVKTLAKEEEEKIEQEKEAQQDPNTPSTPPPRLSGFGAVRSDEDEQRKLEKVADAWKKQVKVAKAFDRIIASQLRGLASSGMEAEIETKQLRFAPIGDATAGDPRVTVRDAKGEAIVLSHRGFSHF